MVVLRHKASEPKILHVYYVAPNLDTTRSAPYGSNIGLPSEQNASSSHVELTWPSSIQINTPLVLGGIYNSAENPPVDSLLGNKKKSVAQAIKNAPTAIKSNFKISSLNIFL